MKYRSFKLMMGSGAKCPDCGSADDIIPWDNGWCCRDCGCEWD